MLQIKYITDMLHGSILRRSLEDQAVMQHSGGRLTGRNWHICRTDETDVPVFTLNRLDEPDGLHGLIEAVPYPLPGDPNPKVKMGIADIGTGKTTWVKTDYSIDQYIAWPFWTTDSKKLAIQIVNRDQNNLKIILADPASGDFTQIYDENRKTWVEFFEDIYVLKNGSGFIVRSYRNDWHNLYLLRTGWKTDTAAD